MECHPEQRTKKTSSLIRKTCPSPVGRCDFSSSDMRDGTSYDTVSGINICANDKHHNYLGGLSENVHHHFDRQPHGYLLHGLDTPPVCLQHSTTHRQLLIRFTLTYTKTLRLYHQHTSITTHNYTAQQATVAVLKVPAHTH